MYRTVWDVVAARNRPGKLVWKGFAASLVLLALAIVASFAAGVDTEGFSGAEGLALVPFALIVAVFAWRFPDAR